MSGNPVIRGSLTPAASAPAELDPERLQEIFHSAAREFGVPVQVLEAVAYVETRWQQVAPEDGGDADEHPPVFGVMGLRDDAWFGHSLVQAAALIHETPDRLKSDPELNVRGAAALLSSLVTGEREAADPLAWVEAVRKYSGIPQDRESVIYIGDVYKTIRDGARRGRTAIQPMPLAVPGFADGREESRAERASAAPEGDSPGDEADEWLPSPNFMRGAIDPRYIVIHDTEGSYAGAVSWLRAPIAQVSAHYVIRSRDGHVSRLVEPTDRAWHARCWNRYAIGIEHEGFVSRPEFFTDEMYRSSARLVRRLAARFGIPLDDMHVFGHNFWQTERFRESPLAELGMCNTHHDPGKHWDWSYYFGLLGADPVEGALR